MKSMLRLLWLLSVLFAGHASAQKVDKHEDVRQSAADESGKINAPAAVEPLIEALKDTNSNVRLAAIRALGEIKDARAVEPLIAAFDDPIADVVRAAAESLRKIGAPAVEGLIAALDAPKSWVRYRAVTVLGEIKDPRAVEPLGKAALRDADTLVRQTAATALGNIKGPRATATAPAPPEAQLGLLIPPIYLLGPTKLPVYMGDGDDISSPNPTGDMSSMLHLRGGLYRAGTISSPADGTELLRVTLICTNASDTRQTFYPLEIDLEAEDAGNAGFLVAAGTGMNSFAKDAATWARLRSSVTLSTGPGNQYESFSYVFVVSKDTSVWKVMYNHIQPGEVKVKR